MLREADGAFVIGPKAPGLQRESDAMRLTSFTDLERELVGLASGRHPAGSTTIG